MVRLAALLSGVLDALRQHPLRSLLSILGLVIGVAALVAILALADGMEQYARDQISTTTDLQNITVSPRTSDRIDGVMIRRAAFAVPTPADAASLVAYLGERVVVALAQQRPEEITFETTHTAAVLFAADAGIWSLGQVEMQRGRIFTAGDVEARRRVVVLSDELASRFEGYPDALVGRSILIGSVGTEILGVLASGRRRAAEAFGPYTAFASDTESRPPAFYLRATVAEEVPLVADQVQAWLDGRFAGGRDAFTVATNELRTAQIRRGMRLFRIVFGLITGISVLVGGVGVMNVLLVSVTERTREIGIRKAVGARRRDIKRQFLAEALTVSGVGSLVGLAVGLISVFALVPVIRYLTDVPFQANLTWGTIIVVSAVAGVVGIVFGTYPAVRAARLSPVDAMRHE